MSEKHAAALVKTYFTWNAIHAGINKCFCEPSEVVCACIMLYSFSLAKQHQAMHMSMFLGVFDLICMHPGSPADDDC